MGATSNESVSPTDQVSKQFDQKTTRRDQFLTMRQKRWRQLIDDPRPSLSLNKRSKQKLLAKLRYYREMFRAWEEMRRTDKGKHRRYPTTYSV